MSSPNTARSTECGALLHSQEQAWNMIVLTSAREALILLSEYEVDTIVMTFECRRWMGSSWFKAGCSLLAWESC